MCTLEVGASSAQEIRSLTSLIAAIYRGLLFIYRSSHSVSYESSNCKSFEFKDFAGVDVKRGCDPSLLDPMSTSPYQIASCSYSFTNLFFEANAS